MREGGIYCYCRMSYVKCVKLGHYFLVVLIVTQKIIFAERNFFKGRLFVQATLYLIPLYTFGSIFNSEFQYFDENFKN